VSALAVKAEVPNSAQRIADENIEMAWAQEALSGPRVVTGVPRSFSILILPILTSVLILIIRETKHSFVLLAILRKHKLG
jgi:hypothetical protein